MTKSRWLPKEHPHHPPDYDRKIIYAWCGFKDGSATPEQQGLIYRYMGYITGTGDWEDMAYRPGGLEAERASSFADGKKFVGLMLRKLENPEVLKAELRAEKVQNVPAGKTRVATRKKRGK